MSEREAVLITGVYGTGKSSVVAELAELLEDAEAPYGALDLDWLMWFDADIDDDERERVFLANLKAVAGNYLDVGAERLVMALSVRDQAQLDGIRNAVSVPLSVVRLVVPYEQIVARLGPDVTVGRQRDLENAKKWLDVSRGVEIGDVEIDNDRPIGETAQEILGWLGWNEGGRIG